ncbi:MAG TPA: ABC transporter permease [Parafilimonas sp.]|nr:ABC transporter permease [Parafilimonas sp.]
MKLLATIKKDMLVLVRDRWGLILMFAMPVVLVITVTNIQSSTFDVVGKNRIGLLVCNKDTGSLSGEFIHALDTAGMFNLSLIDRNANNKQFSNAMHAKDIVIGVVIDPSFSQQVSAKAKNISGKALTSFGLEGDTVNQFPQSKDYFSLYYNPLIPQSLKLSVRGALNSAVQMIQSKEVLKDLYFSINEKPLPDSLQQQMLSNDIGMAEIPLSSNNEKVILNATQHNVPAWTIFAMFFVVISLAASIVREKTSGSFIRLKTLPTSYSIALLSKQITYLIVTFLQAAVIFTIGIYLFPLIDLPALHLPHDIAGLVLVTLVCGWCAVSYALCIGIFAHTQEQANAFGSVSIVILSILGGLMIPSFIMPGSFKSLMAISPLHWCLQAYYGLFLEGGRLKDISINIFSLLLITLALQAIAVFALKRKKLI